MNLFRSYPVMTEVNPQAKTVLVCQNRTCLKQGSAQVLQAFRSQDLPETTEIQEVNCLGQCGSGPMVLILPEESWYSQLDPAEVSMIVEQHLRSGHPVRDLLYSKFHP